MEIGGKDFYLEGPIHPDDLDVMKRTAKAFWPDCYIQEEEEIAFFLHRDRAVSDQIDKVGVTAELSPFIVSVIVDGDCLCFVSSEKEDTDGHRLVLDIRANIQQNRRMFLRV